MIDDEKGERKRLVAEWKPNPAERELAGEQLQN